MKKSWIIKEFLREMTDGFYLDINSDSDESSPTKLLAQDYRWRGLSIAPNDQQWVRPSRCANKIMDVDLNPSGVCAEIYKVHPGTMLHYVYIHRLKDLKGFFNAIYHDDVEVPYSQQTVWPHLNFIGLEINMHGESLPEGMADQLYSQWDVIFHRQEETSFLFVNEIMSYLL
jgi:hypothetical protein